MTVTKLNKITIHWTAGTNQPCQEDYSHYHFLINSDGLVIKGKHKPEDNLNCNDGVYAQHCGGGNTGNIGVSMCGMYGFKSGSSVGNYPLTRKQVEKCFSLVAELAKKYSIPIDKNHIFTHYEFGKAHPKTSSYGKIDIIYLPPYPDVTKDNIGDFIRNKIKWYYSKV